MRIFVFIILVLLGVLLAGSGLAAILVNFNPFEIPSLILILFYLLLFLFSAGLCCLIIFGFKKIFFSKKQPWQLISNSARQALFLALAAVVSLALWQKQWLNWWSLGVVLSVFVVFELWFKLRFSQRV